jgi:hypothetical protein
LLIFILDEVESTSSPPKRGKTLTEDSNAVVEAGTPSQHTPSQLIRRLHLNSPRGSAVTSAEKRLAPKQLFVSGM